MLKKLSSLLILILLAPMVYGANRVTTWSSGNVLTASALNGEFNNVYAGTVERTAGRWGSNDDIPLSLGSSQDAYIEWDTTQAQDALMIGVSGSHHVLLVQKADMGTDLAISAASDPTLIIHSSDATTAADYLALSHNQTNAIVNVGAGAIQFQIAGADAARILSAKYPLVFEGDTADDYETAFQVTDPTEDRILTLPDSSGTLALSGAVSNTFTAVQNISLAAAGTGLKITNADAGTSSGDITFYHNSASPSTSDAIGGIYFNANNSTPAEHLFAFIEGGIYTNTAGSEVGTLTFGVQDGLYKADVLRIGEILGEGGDLGIALYDGAYMRGSWVISSTQNELYLRGADYGNDASGAAIFVSKNQNETNPNPGYIALQRTDGGWGYLWVDTDGKLRIAATPPFGDNDPATHGTVVGDQTGS